MTRLDHHIAVVNACDTAYMVSVTRPTGLYYHVPEKVRAGCGGLARESRHRWLVAGAQREL